MAEVFQRVEKCSFL